MWWVQIWVQTKSHMESFIKSSKNDSNQIPILEKVGFDSNHRVPNRDSDSALLNFETPTQIQTLACLSCRHTRSGFGTTARSRCCRGWTWRTTSSSSSTTRRSGAAPCAPRTPSPRSGPRSTRRDPSGCSDRSPTQSKSSSLKFHLLLIDTQMSLCGVADWELYSVT